MAWVRRARFCGSRRSFGRQQCVESAEKAREDVERLDSLEEIMSLEPEQGVSRWDELDLLFRAGELMGDLKFNTMRAAKDEKDDYEAVRGSTVYCFA